MAAYARIDLTDTLMTDGEAWFVFGRWLESAVRGKIIKRDGFWDIRVPPLPADPINLRLEIRRDGATLCWRTFDIALSGGELLPNIRWVAESVAR